MFYSIVNSYVPTIYSFCYSLNSINTSTTSHGIGTLTTVELVVATLADQNVCNVRARDDAVLHTLIGGLTLQRRRGVRRARLRP